MTYLVRWLEPYDRRRAARTLTALCTCGAAVTIVLGVIFNTSAMSPAALLTTSCAALAVAGVAFALRWLETGHALLWALFPFVAVGALTAINLWTRDPSIAAQSYYYLPALYAASELHRRGAITVLVAVIAGYCTVDYALTDAHSATLNMGTTTVVILTIVELLLRSRARQEQLVQRLEHMAAIDPLTGLVTRRVFDDAGSAALTSAAATDNGTALILLDVDHFKSVNDRHGHPAGDQVLIQIANILTTLSRPEDVICRLGGDEIAILLPGCPLATARARARQALTAIAEHGFTVGGPALIPVTVSIGYAHAPTDATDMQRLYMAADAVLYEAKNAGRARVGTPGRAGSIPLHPGVQRPGRGVIGLKEEQSPRW